ncbi:MAG: T9SS type A sorting domain-containing protein [Chryseolinea sp.]
MKARKHSAAIILMVILPMATTCFTNAQDLPKPLEGCNYQHTKAPTPNSYWGWKQFDRIDIYIDPMNDSDLNACGISKFPAKLQQVEFLLQPFESIQRTLDYTLSFSYPEKEGDLCKGPASPFYTTPVQTVQIGSSLKLITYKPEQKIVVTKPFFISIHFGYFSGSPYGYGASYPSPVWDNLALTKCRQLVYRNDYGDVTYQDFNDLMTYWDINRGNIDIRLLFSDKIPVENGTVPEITFGDDLQDRMQALYDSTDYQGNSYSDVQLIRSDLFDSIKTTIDCGFAFPEQYNRFPKPAIKDDIVGVPYALEFTDEIRGNMAVIRTWTAIDQGGNRSRPFRFIIEYNNETHQVQLSNFQLNNGNEEIFRGDDITVPFGVENTYHILAQNACADAVLVQWFVNDVLIQGQEGETLKYTWSRPGQYKFKALGTGILRKSTDDFEVDIIVPGPEFTINASNTTCFGATDGKLEVIKVKNVAKVKWSTGSNALKIQNLKAGSYFVDVSDADNRTVREEITLTEPAKVEADIASTDELCEGKCDGSLTASNLRGGTPPYSGYWQNITTKDKYPVLSKTDVCAGQFKFIVQDKNKCIAQDYTKEVLKGDPIPVADFTSSGDNSGIIYTFTNTSKNAASYLWDMGDGTKLPSVTFPTFTYTYKTNGVFTVVLTASSTHKCENKVERDVEITRVVGVEDILQSLGMEIYPNPSYTTLTLDNEHGVVLEKVTLSSMQGQDLISVEGSALRQNSVDIDVKHLRQGMYILTIRVDENHTWHKRIMIIH